MKYVVVFEVVKKVKFINLFGFYVFLRMFDLECCFGFDNGI